MINMKEIKDINFEKKIDISPLLEQYAQSGFQASHFAEAVALIERMKKENCTIFLSFTANMVASGLRGAIVELCRKKFVDVIVTTAGSIDHDVIKSLAPYQLGDFNADDIELHKKGLNRIGNIFIPAKNFELFEKEIQGTLSDFKGKDVSVRELISAIGKRMAENNYTDSFLYWCSKNSIPVFCPGITDGAIGLQLYFFKQDNPEFKVDVTADMKELADITLNSENTAAIILGGGISKHHVIGVNILRDGLKYAVYVSTAEEFDGSLSGARTKEAKSWGKIKEAGNAVTVNAEASLVFPLIITMLKENNIL